MDICWPNAWADRRRMQTSSRARHLQTVLAGWLFAAYRAGPAVVVITRPLRTGPNS